MNNYLLEVGVEEFPAKNVDSTKKQFKDKFIKVLNDNEIKYSDIKIESTPRRFTILIENMEHMETNQYELVKGPSKEIAFDKEGNPSKALLGFARSKGIDLSEITIEEEKNGKSYVYGNAKVKVKDIKEILKNETPKIISTISNPRSMRWGGKNLRFLRPIRWIVSLYNDEILDFDMEGIPVSNVTRGHRFLGKSRIEIERISDYQEKLEENYVILSEAKRRDLIVGGIKRLAKSRGGNPLMDEQLLDEVVHIVEYPTPFIGNFDEEYLKLPKEVVITPMKDHQRYFPVLSDDGNLLPYFISVRNGDEKGMENVIEGNEKVLTPRLEDAKFFYELDLKTDIMNQYEKLKEVTFYENLGNMQDKTERLKNLVETIGSLMLVSKNTMEDALRATQLSKIDLVSKMVIEFTELQGTMGRIYALKAGENTSVSQAIEEQYMPIKAKGDLPKSTAGIVLSLSDKIDNIVGLYAIGLEVTGSQDPYGLRRQAIGFINILIENKININLDTLIDRTFVNYVDQFNLVFDYKETRDKIVDFFMNRLRNKLIEEGFRYDIIDSCINTDGTNINSIVEKVKVLDDFSKEESFDDFITSCLRVINLSKDLLNPEINENLIQEQEKDMYNLTQSIEFVENKIDESDYKSALDYLTEEMVIVNDYLDNTMVNVENEALKNNRLSMLQRIGEVIIKLFNPLKIVRD